MRIYYEQRAGTSYHGDLRPPSAPLLKVRVFHGLGTVSRSGFAHHRGDSHLRAGIWLVSVPWMLYGGAGGGVEDRHRCVSTRSFHLCA